jgi:hypothetical protein
MQNKPTWLQFITDTIGISTVFAIILGVPAMILFVSAIWQALCPNQRTMAIVSGSFLLFAVVWFIYSRTRKKLYTIPNLLYRMHAIYQTCANEIDTSEMKEDTSKNLLKIVGLESNITNENEIGEKLDLLYSQSKEKVISPEDVEAMVNYFSNKSGLQLRLEKDQNYVKIMKKINTMRSLLPSEGIALAVNDFIIESKVSTCLDILTRIPTDVLSMYSVKLEAKIISIRANINNDILVSLAKVRESIEMYYKGGMK